MWRASHRSVAPSLAALALIAAGCGSHKPSVAAVAKQDACASQAGHVRADQVVQALIARGSISHAQVDQAFHGLPRTDYLDGTGKLLPFVRLSAGAKLAFVDWVGHLESKTGGKLIFDAEMKATKDAQATCAAA